MSKKILMEMNNSQYQPNLPPQPVVAALPTRRKSVLCAYLWAFPLGLIGAHRFYLGQSLLGLAYLFSGGFFGLGWLYDLMFMSNVVKKVNRRLADPSSRKVYNLTDAYVLCLSPGGLCFGLHQFYLGRKGFGTAYCFTWGMFGVGWVLDIFRMPKLVADANQRAIEMEENPGEKLKKRPRTLDDAYITWIFGFLGTHHFYLGNTGFGFAYLFTLGMFGVGWIVDFFRMPILVKRANDENPSPEKNLDDAYVLTFPLGMLGLQHFYLGRPCWGVTYMFTLGLLFFGYLIDIVRMPYLVREVNEAIRESQNLVAVVVDSNANPRTSYQSGVDSDIKKVPLTDNTTPVQYPVNPYPIPPPIDTKAGPPPSYVSNC